MTHWSGVVAWAIFDWSTYLRAHDSVLYDMSPLSPPGTLSLGDSLYTSAKVCSVPKGPERSTWGEKAQDSEPPSLTPQAPVRSALKSINIVVACTSSLMITSALGSAVTISLPYMGKDLNIRKGDLQWILSAYSISSVSICVIMPHRAWLTLHRLVFSSFAGDLQTFMGANSSGLLDI
jgi:hypothetical protein